MKLAALTTCLMIVAVAPALGQTTPSSPAPTQGTAAPAAAPSSPTPETGKKREACKAAASKLRGMERADSMQICMAEARLACVKDAVAQKIPVPKRKDFLKSCIGERPE